MSSSASAVGREGCRLRWMPWWIIVLDCRPGLCCLVVLLFVDVDRDGVDEIGEEVFT